MKSKLLQYHISTWKGLLILFLCAFIGIILIGLTSLGAFRNVPGVPTNTSESLRSTSLNLQEWNTYENQELSLTFQFPSTWKTVEGKYDNGDSYIEVGNKEAYYHMSVILVFGNTVSSSFTCDSFVNLEEISVKNGEVKACHEKFNWNGGDRVTITKYISYPKPDVYSIDETYTNPLRMQTPFIITISYGGDYVNQNMINKIVRQIESSFSLPFE